MKQAKPAAKAMEVDDDDSEDDSDDDDDEEEEGRGYSYRDLGQWVMCR